MIESRPDEMSMLKSLCEETKDVCLLSAIEGKMGQGWADGKTEPQLAFVRVADFFYILGDYKSIVDKDLLEEHLIHAKRRIIKVQDPQWIPMLEKLNPESFRRFYRYAVKDVTGFDRKVLNSYVTCAEKSFRIERIDEKIYHKVMSDPFMADCCCFFPSQENFMKNGSGYAIIQDDEIIAAASSYSYCEGAIDITIGTKDEYRQRGLAKAVAAKLILECMDEGIRPVWDAVDTRSVALAEKLGYTFEKAYEVYMI